MTESKARELQWWLLELNESGDYDCTDHSRYLDDCDETWPEEITVVSKSYADQLQAELSSARSHAEVMDHKASRLNEIARKQDELLRECEKALEMIATNIKRESKYLHWTSVDIAKEMLQKLREGKP